MHCWMRAKVNLLCCFPTSSSASLSCRAEPMVQMVEAATDQQPPLLELREVSLFFPTTHTILSTPPPLLHSAASHFFFYILLTDFPDDFENRDDTMN